jgi:EmrB/QacA subfamily drug resistance transporter
MNTAPPLAPSGKASTILAIIVTSYLMIVVDISIVITGLPRIQAELGFSAAQLSWVTNAYTLTFGGLLLLGARAGDILGRRRMFLTGLALFTLASMAIGAAQSAAWLLAARAIQGMGSAVLAPSTLALLSTHFPEGPARTRALSMYAAAAGVGATLGLVLGGLFADLLSWRAGFFINLPIGLLLLVAAKRQIAETTRRPGRFDIGGAVSSTAGMGALVYGLVRVAEAGWQDTLALTALLSGLALTAVFVLIERRVSQPILPLRLLASRERVGAYLARMLFLGGAVGFWFFSTQFLQGVLHLRPMQAGLAFLSVTLPNFASAMAVPKLARRFGNERLILSGLALGVIGLLWLGQADAAANYWRNIAPPMLFIGLGQGLLLGPLTAAGVAGVAHEDAGAASGLVNVAHQLGGALGLGVLVLVFARANPGSANDAQALAHRISAVMSTAGLLLAVALLISWIPIVSPRNINARQEKALP